jgi:hypothetical protein
MSVAQPDFAPESCRTVVCLEIAEKRNCAGSKAVNNTPYIIIEKEAT